jgi:hypothetical protein
LFRPVKENVVGSLWPPKWGANQTWFEQFKPVEELLDLSVCALSGVDTRTTIALLGLLDDLKRTVVKLIIPHITPCARSSSFLANTGRASCQPPFANRYPPFAKTGIGWYSKSKRSAISISH